MVSAATAHELARGNGYRVFAGGEVVGAVATPVFSGTALLPDYLLVRVDAPIGGAYRAIPPDLIDEADSHTRAVFLRVTADEVAVLPEQAPG